MRILLLTITLLILQATNAQDHGRGLEFDRDLYGSIPMKAKQTRGLYTSLPSKASLKQYCPLPGDQQHYSTCVGWAVGYAARTILWAKQNNIKNRSTITSNAFSPAFIYRSISRDNTCKSGTHTSKAIQILKTKGNVLQSDFSDACPSSIPYGLYAKASKSKIESYAKLFEYNASAKDKIESVKKSIAENNPVVFGMLVPPSFSAVKGELWQPNLQEQNGQFGCPCGDGSSRPECCGHAICVVGYDNHKYGGAFEILNSWGTRWGNEGFVWVKYADFANFTVAAYELINNIAPQPVVVHPPKPTPPSPKPKPRPIPKPTPVKDFDFAGDLRFVLLDGSKMKGVVQEVRGLTVVEEDENPPPSPKPKPNPNNFDYDSKLTTGKFIAYRMDKAYTEGTKFRVYLRNSQPAYVYALAMDNTNQAAVLFPHKPSISPALNYANNEVALPSEKSYIMMDNIKGTDVFCLLYSKEELDINAISRQLENQTGTFFQRLYKTMKHKLVPRNYLRYYNQRMRFEIKSEGSGTVVPIVVEIPHN